MEEKNKKNRKVEKVTKEYHQNKDEIPSDVLGSYTGTTQDYETPVQDADDL